MSGSLTVLLVLEDAKGKEGTLSDAVHADVVEGDILNYVVVTTDDGHAALIVNLTLVLLQNVDVTESHLPNGVADNVIVAALARIPLMGPSAYDPIRAGRSERSNFRKLGTSGMGNSSICSTKAAAERTPIPAMVRILIRLFFLTVVCFAVLAIIFPPLE